MEEQTTQQNNKTLTGVAIFAIIAILAFVLNNSKPETNTLQTGQSPQQIITPTPSTSESTTLVDSQIADGVYEATGEYTSPAGPEVVPIKLTLKDGVIESIEFNQKATNPNTIKFQGMFKEGYKTLVVGKKITDVKLDKVSGSSLTPKGFNDAIQKIITQNT
ncbi:hypothetical protein A2572_04545 [Candidatus Collierbacteria bacterium RIFOXYD1_FULL_40_9]|uniref:FMN-binding domain-containing protein n=1 Tax=Candidatus Collierbacteria bacterium RIFOXYD1_FULL_40_9 TaxID=1817731 RepID=A0A1F5FPP6_9BACT|nr:MAG: hypothetical protein A2572_04545 [Candidatus Collierbacteria bacterium RIFOXYD1_FULL_40_9]